MIKGTSNSFEFGLGGRDMVSRKTVVAAILGIALIAFEVFNFDTTQYALSNLLGEVSFAKVMWSTILAIAFCAIDFAGLVRIFTPQRGREEPRAVWFLTGAWFLGTIANSVMTWWAVSLTLLSHDFGNEVLSREMLLRYVPIFVAMLVWLTRILFIGAFSVAGEDLFELRRMGTSAGSQTTRPDGLPASKPERKQVPQPAQAKPATARPASSTAPRAAAGAPTRTTPNAPSMTYEPVDDPVVGVPPPPKTNGPAPVRPTSRIQQRPPVPGGVNRPMPGKMHAGPSGQRTGPVN